MYKIKNIDIYLDGLSIDEIKKYKSSQVKGYTYNPTLMSKINTKNYLNTCKKLSNITYPKPISLEVIADDEKSMINQAKILSKINNNIYVKIPITYTNGKYTTKVIKELVKLNIKLNITAIFSIHQIKKILSYVKNTESILSIFAGRIHDMGEDAFKEISKIDKLLKKNNSKCKLLWASTRQIYDLVLAKKCGCKIITMGLSIYNKRINFKKNWKNSSLETVKTFYNDAIKSKFKL